MAIVKDIITVLKHIPVNADFSFSLIEPFIDQAEETYLVPLLGREFYNEIEAVPSADGKLMTVIERAVSNIAFWLYLPLGNVQISNSGIHISSDSNTKTAFEWQVNRVLNSLSRLGMDNIEIMLMHLEENIDDFLTFKNSAIRTQNNGYFLNTASEFNEHYSIDRSRLTFICLQTISRQVQRELIDPMLTGILVTDLTEEAIICIKNTIAFKTICDAIPQLAVEVSHLGLSANYLSMINNVNYKTPASDGRVQMLLSHVKEKAAAYLRDIPSLLPGYVEDVAGGTIDPTDLKIFPFM